MAKKRKSIVRVFGTDLPGEVSIENGLRQIKGISFSTSKSILHKAGLDADKLVSDMSDKEMDKVKDIIENSNLPVHMLNRRKDPNEGTDRQLVSSDLEIQHKQDIDAMKKLGSYRGLRHRRGLPVRGQKTKSSFRGKSSVGVSKARIKKGK